MSRNAHNPPTQGVRERGRTHGAPAARRTAGCPSDDGNLAAGTAIAKSSRVDFDTSDIEEPVVRRRRRATTVIPIGDEDILEAACVLPRARGTRPPPLPGLAPEASPVREG